MKKHEVSTCMCKLRSPAKCDYQFTTPLGSTLCDTVSHLEQQVIDGADTLEKCPYSEFAQVYAICVNKG